MTQQTTDADLFQAERILNNILTEMGSTARYVVSGRYSYITIDEYCTRPFGTDKGEWRMRYLYATSLTKKEARLILEAMIDVLNALPEREE